MQKLSFQRMKQYHEQTILKQIRDFSPISRTELAINTNLTPATVSKITGKLLAEGLIHETRVGESSGGRRPILLEINPKGGFIIGLAIAKGRIEFLLADLELNHLAYKELTLETTDHLIICDQSVELIFQIIKEQNIPQEKILGLGISLHGLVNYQEGISLFAPHLGWRQVPLKKLLRKSLNFPIFIDNDVRLMALGEMWRGAGQTAHNFTYVNVDYGVGMGLVLNQQLYRGINHAAGEIGHTVVNTDGPLCSCGKKGCLEAVISLQALANENEHVIREKVAHYLGLSLANLMTMLDLEKIILGGRVFDLAPGIISAVRQEFSKRVVFDDQKKIVRGALKERASIIGAVTMILSDFYERGSL